MKRLVIGLGLALAPIIGWIAGGDEYIELRHDRSQIALMYYLIAFVFTAVVAERLDERRARRHQLLVPARLEALSSHERTRWATEFVRC